MVEYNLFEKADGDNEAISVKSSDNIVRYNTLRNSRGEITLRHGNRNRVDGNFIIGGISGIRFFGNDHVIVNNVVQGISGKPIQVGSGDDPRRHRQHHRPRGRRPLPGRVQHPGGQPQRHRQQVGNGKRYAPDRITVANNIVVGTGSSPRSARAPT